MIYLIVVNKKNCAVGIFRLSEAEKGVYYDERKDFKLWE